MEPKESDIILEALKCLRYDTERIEKLVLTMGLFNKRKKVKIYFVANF